MTRVRTGFRGRTLQQTPVGPSSRPRARPHGARAFGPRPTTPSRPAPAPSPSSTSRARCPRPRVRAGGAQRAPPRARPMPTRRTPGPRDDARAAVQRSARGPASTTAPPLWCMCSRPRAAHRARAPPRSRRRRRAAPRAGSRRARRSPSRRARRRSDRVVVVVVVEQAHPAGSRASTRGARPHAALAGAARARGGARGRARPSRRRRPRGPPRRGARTTKTRRKPRRPGERRRARAAVGDVARAHVRGHGRRRVVVGHVSARLAVPPSPAR